MKKIIYILFPACFLLASCEDFLNRDPDAEVGSGDCFKDGASLLTYVNGFLNNYTPSSDDLGFGDGYCGHRGYRKVLHVPDKCLVDTRLADRMGDQQLDTDLQHQLLSSYTCGKQRGFREATYNHYEGTGALLARMAVFRDW